MGSFFKSFARLEPLWRKLTPSRGKRIVSYFDSFPFSGEVSLRGPMAF